MALIPRLSASAVVLALFFGCAPQAPVHASCSTQADCDAALAAVKMQIAQCSGAECNAAYAQQGDILNRLVVLQSQRRAQAMSEDDRAGQVNAQILADQERQRDAEKARVQASRDWRSSVMQTCSEGWSTALCDTAPADAAPADVAFCRTFCSTQADRHKERAFHAALDACVTALKARHGHGSPACTFSAPDEAQASLQARGEECATQCKTRAAGELSVQAEARAADQAIARGRRPAPAAPVAPPRPFGTVGSLAVMDMVTPLFPTKSDFDEAMKFAATKDADGYKALIARVGVKVNAGAEVRVMALAAPGAVLVMIDDGVNIGKLGWTNLERLKPE